LVSPHIRYFKHLQTLFGPTRFPKAWPYALHLLHGLQPLQPDLVTFNASIAAVADIAWDKTLQLLRELKATMQGAVGTGTGTPG
jgi:hypothetical protein